MKKTMGKGVILMLLLMTVAWLMPLHAQTVTYNHDASVMNQFLVGETGAGHLTPDLYYDALHKSYRNSAMMTSKQMFRLQMMQALSKEETHAEVIDSMLTDRTASSVALLALWPVHQVPRTSKMAAAAMTTIVAFAVPLACAFCFMRVRPPVLEHHEHFRQYEADQAAARERQDPRRQHALRDIPVDLADVLRRADAHDRRRRAMGRGNRHARDAGYEQREHGADRSGDALVLLQLHHVHGDRLDDALAAEEGAERDGQRARDHEPHREPGLVGRLHAERQRDAQDGDRHELLAVLRAMQERQQRRAHVLCRHEQLARRAAVHAGEHARGSCW